MAAYGPVLGLDYGSRRIGLAVSDLEGQFAFPAGHLERKGLKSDLEALRRLIEERGVTRVVVGLPIHMNGRTGPEADAARAFGAALARETGCKVDMLDERWTTLEARRRLRETRRRPRPGELDAAAATLLLQTFLERERAVAGRDEA
jgi:putative Holliday junction resolvase